MFKKLLKISIILALVVVILGAWTRLSDAGLGCPDWPGCYGQLSVPDVATGTTIEGYQRPIEPSKGWKEMVHRYAAALLGLVVLWLFLLVARGKTQSEQSIMLPSFLLFLVLFQGALGRWTVTELVHPGIVSMHLIGGFTTTALLLWLLLNQSRPIFIYRHILKRHKYLLILLLILLSVQIGLGGWTSANYAALVCGQQFPQCLSQWWPEMNFADAFRWGALGVNYEYGVLADTARTAVHMTHRVGALVFSLMLLLLIYLFRKYHHLKSNLILIGVLLILQVVLGIANVILSLPIWTAIFHNAVALLLLLSLVALLHKIFRVPE